MLNDILYTGVGFYRARAHKPFLSFINRALVGRFSGLRWISGSHKKKIFLFAPQIKRKGTRLDTKSTLARLNSRSEALGLARRKEGRKQLSLSRNFLSSRSLGSKNEARGGCGDSTQSSFRITESLYIEATNLLLANTTLLI